jgi:hypothetical protein
MVVHSLDGGVPDCWKAWVSRGDDNIYPRGFFLDRVLDALSNMDASVASKAFSKIGDLLKKKPGRVCQKVFD